MNRVMDEGRTDEGEAVSWDAGSGEGGGERSGTRGTVEKPRSGHSHEPSATWWVTGKLVFRKMLEGGWERCVWCELRVLLPPSEIS